MTKLSETLKMIPLDELTGETEMKENITERDNTIRVTTGSGKGAAIKRTGAFVTAAACAALAVGGAFWFANRSKPETDPGTADSIDSIVNTSVGRDNIVSAASDDLNSIAREGLEYYRMLFYSDEDLELAKPSIHLFDEQVGTLKTRVNGDLTDEDRPRFTEHELYTDSVVKNVRMVGVRAFERFIRIDVAVELNEGCTFADTDTSNIFGVSHVLRLPDRIYSDGRQVRMESDGANKGIFSFEFELSGDAYNMNNSFEPVNIVFSSEMFSAEFEAPRLIVTYPNQIMGDSLTWHSYDGFMSPVNVTPMFFDYIIKSVDYSAEGFNLICDINSKSSTVDFSTIVNFLKAYTAADAYTNAPAPLVKAVFSDGSERDLFFGTAAGYSATGNIIKDSTCRLTVELLDEPMDISKLVKFVFSDGTELLVSGTVSAEQPGIRDNVIRTIELDGEPRYYKIGTEGFEAHYSVKQADICENGICIPMKFIDSNFGRADVADMFENYKMFNMEYPAILTAVMEDGSEVDLLFGESGFDAVADISTSNNGTGVPSDEIWYTINTTGTDFDQNKIASILLGGWLEEAAPDDSSTARDDSTVSDNSTGILDVTPPRIESALTFPDSFADPEQYQYTYDYDLDEFTSKWSSQYKYTDNDLFIDFSVRNVRIEDGKISFTMHYNTPEAQFVTDKTSDEMSTAYLMPYTVMKDEAGNVYHFLRFVDKDGGIVNVEATYYTSGDGSANELTLTADISEIKEKVGVGEARAVAIGNTYIGLCYDF